MKNKVERRKDILKNIKLIILDVDGVLSDGKIIYDESGNNYRIFHVHDGYGIRLARQAGIKVVFVSGRYSLVVDKRAEDIGVDGVYQNIEDKAGVLKILLAKYKVTLKGVCAVGDDLLDLPILTKVGYPVAVANARPEVRDAARYITKLTGGNGAVREIIDIILKARKGYGKRHI